MAVFVSYQPSDGQIKSITLYAKDTPEALKFAEDTAADSDPPQSVLYTDVDTISDSTHWVDGGTITDKLECPAECVSPSHIITNIPKGTWVRGFVFPDEEINDGFFEIVANAPTTVHVVLYHPAYKVKNIEVVYNG